MSPPITSSDPPANATTALSLDHAIEHFLSDLPAETARRIRLASGIDTTTLRAAYSESRQVPALLLDTRLRFELDQEIQDFIDGLSHDSPAVAEVTTLSWQLQLLSLEQLWPATSVLQVYDPPEDSAAAEYGPDLSPHLPRVRVSRAWVLDGSLWSSACNNCVRHRGRHCWVGSTRPSRPSYRHSGTRPPFFCLPSARSCSTTSMPSGSNPVIRW